VRFRLVADEDGEPLSDYTYRFFDDAGALRLTGQPSGPGTARSLTLIDAGHPILEFSCGGRQPVTRRLDLEAQADIDLGDVRLARGGACVRVRFLADPTLRPFLWLSYADPGNGLTRRINAQDLSEGFELWTSPGHLTLSVQAFEQEGSRERIRSAELDAVEGETREVEIDLR
jgi:hypothetical protein